MPSFVVGQSMLPTVHPGAIVGVNKLAYCRCPPQRGDIVLVFTGKELLVKRIIGLPGDEISVMKGFVYINGKALEEPYLYSRDEALTIGTAKLALDQFVIAGDNRRESVIALVNRERIIGRLTGY